MKMAFYSNYLSEHQIPFCKAMSELTEFYFVATEPMAEERLAIGFKDANTKFNFIVRTYEDGEQYKRAIEIGKMCDVVIIGSAPDVFIAERMKLNKLTFRYCERYFKQGKWRILDPRVFIYHYKRDYALRKKNLYMLCASSYTSSDCRFIRSYIGKTYKWGYFPDVIMSDEIPIREASKDKTVKILWVARLVKLKNPYYPYWVAKRLLKNNYNIELNIIGKGDMEQELRTAISADNLNDKIHLLGSMPPADVHKHMQQAEIFLFTSNMREGWGAVVNESMSSGCAVVASGEAGSVDFLIKDGYNGFIYRHNKLEELYAKTEKLVLDYDLRSELGKNAYLTIKDIWSAQNAALRLVELSKGLLSGNLPRFDDGPCSEAK